MCYSLDKDLSSGCCYSPLEQLKPTWRLKFSLSVFHKTVSEQITVTLKMDWDAGQGEGKEIPASVIMKVHNGTTLMEIVNKAAEDNKTGPYNKYDSVYHGGIGYVITGMYGIKDNPVTALRAPELRYNLGRCSPAKARQCSTCSEGAQ